MYSEVIKNSTAFGTRSIKKNEDKDLQGVNTNLLKKFYNELKALNKRWF